MCIRRLRPTISSGLVPHVRSDIILLFTSPQLEGETKIELAVSIPFIGRFVSDSSPINRYVPFCAATNPASIRIVEPELPQSRSFFGW